MMTRSWRLSRLRWTFGLVLLAGLHGAARAQGGCLSGGTGGCPPDSGTPEIDPSVGAGGLALLGGVVMVVRSRRDRQG